MYPARFGICRLRHLLPPVPEEVPVLPFAVLEEDAASLRLPEDAAFFRLPAVFLFLAELLELPAELEAPEELAAAEPEEFLPLSGVAAEEAPFLWEEAVLFFLLELLLRLLEEPWLVVGREEDVVPLRLPPLQAAIDSAMAQASKRTETRLVRVFIGHIHLSVFGSTALRAAPAACPAAGCFVHRKRFCFRWL